VTPEIKMISKTILASAAIAALLGGTAMAQDAPAGNAAGAAPAQPNAQASTPPAAQQAPASADQIEAGTVTDPQEFANTATIANLFEIQSSQLALKNASRDDVKAFAQSMIDDHTKAGEDMKTAAGAQGVTLPTDLDQEHADMLAQLQAASGDQFDQLYIQMQTDAHIKAVALFKGYSQNGGDGVLKDFASKVLPTLEHHYDMVLQLQK
jgi:putative membrane protein